MLERNGEIQHGCRRIRFRHEGHVITLHHLHETLSHTVALRTAYRRRQRLQADFGCEAARSVDRINEAVVAQSLDFRGCFQRVVEVVFDSRQHHITHHVAAITGRRRDPTHRFAAAAIQCERHAQRFAIVTAKLEAVRAPALVAACDCDLVIVATLRSPWHQRRVRAHDSVYAFGVDRRQAGAGPFTSQDAPDAPVAIARQLGHDQSDFFDQNTIVPPSQLASIPPLGRTRGFATTFERVTPRTSQTGFIGRSPAARASAQPTFLLARTCTSNATPTRSPIFNADARKAIPDDAARCIEIRGRTRENAFSEAELRALGITADTWHDGIANGAFSGYVCCAGDTTIGYCFGERDAAGDEILTLRLD